MVGTQNRAGYCDVMCFIIKAILEALPWTVSVHFCWFTSLKKKNMRPFKTNFHNKMLCFFKSLMHHLHWLEGQTTLTVNMTFFFIIADERTSICHNGPFILKQNVSLDYLYNLICLSFWKYIGQKVGSTNVMAIAKLQRYVIFVSHWSTDIIYFFLHAKSPTWFIGWSEE